jgi:phosphoglycolate phosphatase
MLPKGLSTDDLRKYPNEHYQFKYTKQFFTPEGPKKPDTVVLISILKQLSLDKADCIYVGDSLMKDVAMALDSGIDDAWAQYGIAHKRPEYQLLRDVTHWSGEEVARERIINEREHVIPTLILHNSFSELLDIVEFVDRR